MPPGATPTRLPARDLTGGDVRDLRFQQALRGYKCSEVDWALERLAAEVDALRDRVAIMEGGAPAPRRRRLRPDPDRPAGRPALTRPGRPRAARRPRGSRPGPRRGTPALDDPGATGSVEDGPPWRAARSRCRSTSTLRSRRCGRVVTDWESQGELDAGHRGAGHARATAAASAPSSPRPPGVGPLGVTDTMEIVGWDPPHRATGHATPGGSCGAAACSRSLEREGPGGREASTFDWSELLDLPLGPLGALGWPVVRPASRWACVCSLDAMARHCEELAER